MDCITENKIIDAFQNIREVSFAEKKEPIDQEAQVNKLLDNILLFKGKLNARSAKLEVLTERLESLTWLNDLDEECLKKINDLISSGKDLHSTLIRRYVSYGFLRSRGIAKEEIKRFKKSIDDLKESYSDLESVFFYLPAMPNFKDHTKELSLL